MRAQNNDQHISIGNDLAEIAKVMTAFESFATNCAVPEAVANRFNDVFDEMLSNIIYYGYRDDVPHEITIAFNRQDDRLSVIISDDGIAFDPFAATTPNTELPLAEREIGGLGIHLVRNMMHEVHYRRDDGRNIITLVQNLE